MFIRFPEDHFFAGMANGFMLCLLVLTPAFLVIMWSVS